MKTFLTILSILLFCGLLAQEIPQKISYQGKLLEDGSPVNGTKDISFNIGTWIETQNVEITDGLYSVTLGDVNPIPIDLFYNSSTLNLKIYVDGSPLMPDTEILAVPFAFKSEESVNSQRIAGNLVTGNPSAGQILKWDGTQWSPINELDLPYYNNYNAGDTIPAFEIERSQTQEECKVARFGIDNASNNHAGKVLQLYKGEYLGGYYSDPLLEITNNGTEPAIAIYNSYDAKSALHITNWSPQNVMQISSYDINNTINIHKMGSSGYGLYVSNLGNYQAAYFNGDVEITGNLIGGKSNSKIDHPTDPENKYLYHSTVESSEMMNVYNGNITLDENGEGIVNLPDWFEALNGDFRYQLTCIGGFAPVFISSKISKNTFTIGGGTPGLEVSWQVTGIRQDPWAQKNIMHVEVDKNEEEKGHYLHYKEYNQPIEKSILSVNDPEALENLKTRKNEGN